MVGELLLQLLCRTEPTPLQDPVSSRLPSAPQMLQQQVQQLRTCLMTSDPPPPPDGLNFPKDSDLEKNNYYTDFNDINDIFFYTEFTF